MKLLLDENLSRRLVPMREAAFPGTQHVDDVGLHSTPDVAIWEFAARESYALVSKDDDFRQLSLLRGAPPKVLVLAVGNGGDAAVLSLLQDNRIRIETFDADEQESLMLLRASRR